MTVCEVANPYTLFVRVYESQSPPPLESYTVRAQIMQILYAKLQSCMVGGTDRWQAKELAAGVLDKGSGQTTECCQAHHASLHAGMTYGCVAI